MKRRAFIKQGGAAVLLGMGGAFPLGALSAEEMVKVVILHTNDTHSRIEPFPEDGGRYSGLGGCARRAALIDRIRGEEEHVLLLDAGDILQGTPYFNMYQGKLEFRLMNEMGYDAATIGNHDFDAGIGRLRELADMAQFPMLNANYDFSDTPMHEAAPDHTILERGGVKIGLFGLGVELQGLVPATAYENTRYQDPLDHAQRQARLLRDKGCHYVICLSHLGYRYRSDKVSDAVIAANSKDIDLIIGGHTHTFLDTPVLVRNEDGEPVLIAQVGWAGIKLGRIDLLFERSGKKVCHSCSNEWIGDFAPLE